MVEMLKFLSEFITFLFSLVGFPECILQFTYSKIWSSWQNLQANVCHIQWSGEERWLCTRTSYWVLMFGLRTVKIWTEDKTCCHKTKEMKTKGMPVHIAFWSRSIKTLQVIGESDFSYWCCLSGMNSESVTTTSFYTHCLVQIGSKIRMKKGLSKLCAFVTI